MAKVKTVRPVGRFEGEFELPADKSILHRAMMLHSVAEGEGKIFGGGMGEDCLRTAACLRALGAKISIEDGVTVVRGAERLNSGLTLECGNSATTMRLLAGLLAGRGIDVCLTGDESLSRRPMERVAMPLRELGARVETAAGLPPMRIRKSELIGKEIRLSGASAQVKSAVMLAGLCAEGETVISAVKRSRDHTERLLSQMGAEIAVSEGEIRVKKSRLRAIDVDVPADISAAAYFMALGALKGKTVCKNVGVNGTRTGILDAFSRMGVCYRLENLRMVSGEERADIVVEKSPLRGIEIGGDEVASMIDELPLIALTCALAAGESRIFGAKELRIKESDRIAATAALINGLGGECVELEDGLLIRGKKTLIGGTVDSCSDHRIAMTAAVGLAVSRFGGGIVGGDCCRISFPDFFEKMEQKSGLAGAGIE